MEKQLESYEDEEDDDNESSDGDDDDDDDPWTVEFKQLRQYRVDHGDCKVPRNYERSPSLGQWVNNQRRSYNNVQTGNKKGRQISQERIAKLDSIGFFWVSFSKLEKATCFYFLGSSSRTLNSRARNSRPNNIRPYYFVFPSRPKQSLSTRRNK